MFALFFSLYYAMFSGSWTNYTLTDIASQNGTIRNALARIINSLGTFLTSMFNNVETPMTNLGDLVTNPGTLDYLVLVAFVLALITSIGIVVMAVKGIKRVFGVFFMLMR